MRDKPAKPDVEELTFFEGNGNGLTVRKKHKWWHVTTHKLLSQQEDSENGYNWVWHEITHKLASQ